MSFSNKFVDETGLLAILRFSLGREALFLGEKVAFFPFLAE